MWESLITVYSRTLSFLDLQGEADIFRQVVADLRVEAQRQHILVVWGEGWGGGRGHTAVAYCGVCFLSHCYASCIIVTSFDPLLRCPARHSIRSVFYQLLPVSVVLHTTA